MHSAPRMHAVRRASLGALLLLLGFGIETRAAEQVLRVVAAQSIAETGLLDALATEFSQKNPNVRITVRPAGGLQVLDLGRRGEGDLLITHVPAAEKLFVEQGFAPHRTTICYNEFAIFGPSKDPVGLARITDLSAALQALAKVQAEFKAPSRRSGTADKLDHLWDAAGVTPNWIGYDITQSSSATTLEQAAIFGAYTFIDLATYVTRRDSIAGDIRPLYRDNSGLRNYYSALVPSAKHFPQTKQALAERFLEYLVSDAAQQMIAEWGDRRFGTQLFFPAARFDEGLAARRAEQAVSQQARQIAILTALVLVLMAATGAAFAMWARARVSESQRRVSEERFVLAVSGTSDGIFDWDIERERTFLSRRMIEMLGRNGSENYEGSLRHVLFEDVHPQDRDSLLAKLDSYIASPSEDDTVHLEFRLAQREGTEARDRWVVLRAKANRGPQGNAERFSGSLSDITERKQQEAVIAYQTVHDALTGLPNRVLLHERLQYAIETAERYKLGVALIVMDLDRFKEINDTLGHKAGDRIVKQVSQRLTRAVQASETVARLGGDEFAILLPHASAAYANHAAQKMMLALQKKFDLDDGEQIYVRGSIGIALFPEHGTDAETLIRHADVAMYLAKRTGKGLAVYDAAHDTHSVRRLALEKDLREAIVRNELTLHYQPIYDLNKNHILSVEALVRWAHPSLGAIRPDEVVRLAEDSGQMRDLTHWVLSSAVMQGAEWRRRGIGVRVAVNLSITDFQDPRLVERVKEVCDAVRLPASHLEIEITETVMASDPDHVLSVMKELRSLGVHIAIDDFGTGFSSLAYLRRMPVTSLKIDRSFVQAMAADKEGVIVRSTIDLAHNLGIRVVAEGIEDQETLDALRGLACDLGQGYHLGRPVPAAELNALENQRLSVISGPSAGPAS